MRSQKRGRKLRIRKFHSKRSVFSKFFLKMQGKRDGKRGIPFVDSSGKNMSPNIKKEHDKIDVYVAQMINAINYYTIPYFCELQERLAAWETKLEEATKLKGILKDAPSDISLYIPKTEISKDLEGFLDSKHRLEVALDPLSIRERRFEEYQNKLKKYRQKYDSLCADIDKIYISIMKLIELIRSGLNLLEPMFWEARAVIDMRLSWYWQGVLRKHSAADKLPPTAPQPDYAPYACYIQAKLDELKKIEDDVWKKYQAFKKM